MITYYVPSTVLGAKDIAVNKTNKFLMSWSLYCSGRKHMITKHVSKIDNVLMTISVKEENEEEKGAGC